MKLEIQNRHLEIQQRLALALALVIIAAALVWASGSYLERSGQGDVSVCIRDLRRHDDFLSSYWQTIWPIIPTTVQSWIGYHTPVPAEQRRLQAAAQLRTFGAAAQPAIPALVRALDDSSMAVQQTALATLGELGTNAASAVPDLLRLFRDQRSSLASQAGVALSRIAPSNPVVLQMCFRALESRPSSSNSLGLERRLAAVAALERMAPYSKEVVPRLMAAAREPTAFWKQVLETLGRIRQPAEVIMPVLIEGLDSNEWEGSAVDALWSMGPAAASALPKLVEKYRETRVEDGTPAGAGAVNRELLPPRTFFFTPIGTEPLLWRRYGMPAAPSDRKSRIHLALLRTFAAIGPAAVDVIPELEQEYQNRRNAFRLASAFSRWKIDGKAEAIVPVFQEAASTSPALAAAVLHFVAEMAPRSNAVWPLIQFGLDHSMMSLRIQSIRIVGSLNQEASAFVPQLTRALADPKFAVRSEASNALRRVILAKRTEGIQEFR